MLHRPAPTARRRQIGLALTGTAMITALGLTATPVLADQSVQPALLPAPPTMPPATHAVRTDGVRHDDGQPRVRMVRTDRTITILTDQPVDQPSIDQTADDVQQERAPTDRSSSATERVTDPAGDNEVMQIRSVILNRRADGHLGEAGHSMALQRVSGNAFVFRNSYAPHEANAAIIVTNDCGARRNATDMLDQRGNADGQTTRVHVVTCGDAPAHRAQQLTAMRAARTAMANAPVSHRLSTDRRARALSAIDARIAALERATN